MRLLAGWGLLNGRGENLHGFNRIEAIRLAAEIAVHMHKALLGQNAFNFFLPQAAQHICHALGAAIAMKMRNRVTAVWREAQNLLVPEQAVQNGVDIQFQQFLASKALRQNR